jgi:hypothetical protein
MNAGQYIHLDVTLYHPGDLIPDDTQHNHLDGPQHIHVDVHFEDSVSGKK